MFFWDTPSGLQGLLLALCAEIATGWLRGPYSILGIKPGSSQASHMQGKHSTIVLDDTRPCFLDFNIHHINMVITWIDLCILLGACFQMYSEIQYLVARSTQHNTFASSGETHFWLTSISQWSTAHIFK